MPGVSRPPIRNAPARKCAKWRAFSRDTLDQVREAVRGYRGSGLAEEISGIRKTLETADIGFHMEVEPVDLAPEQESALALRPA